MIANEPPVIANSLWTATANMSAPHPPLTGSLETEVAIIGGGFTGLSAALHLAERGIACVVLEAETPGWGASGRNGGQVNPGLHPDPEEITTRFGADMGGRMLRLSGTAGQLVFDLVARYGIDCDARPVGWLRGAHDAAGLRDLHHKAAQWQRLGAAVEPLDAAGIADLSGSAAYRGGLIDHRGGNLHPLNYALGLAAAAVRAGAAIHGHSRVLRIEADGSTHILTTTGGSLRARRVLICTNAYTDAFAPGLARTVVPVRSVQVATEPLPPEVLAGILPGEHALSDTRRLLLYYRRDAAGRFIMGGRGAYGAAATRTRMKALRQVSAKLYPQLDGVRWTHAWGGFVAVTTDHFPHLDRLGKGIMAGLGYNGRGVAMATAMGRVMADWASGTPEVGLDFPVTDPRPIPFHGLRRLGVAATVAKYRLLDALGL
ncbi:NAD(P)/FAD-dependent oxidoreductase [Ruegeria marina]|uniref:Glycine/D-amino acid oxidase n=1 Tax=Ruegeria marina TaxID=639004 RepID=A0A1G7AC80_9RHOB|nr:FAD-binding oxidoreductase [Ruegeria marina]SDE12401.1 Glycine/D-amino acid oxidase [Ruegeria marina]